MQTNSFGGLGGVIGYDDGFTVEGDEAMSIVMYGIPNCDTVKKARTWLADNGVEFAFHDYKKSGVPLDGLEMWVAEHGWEVVLNRAGTTFRKLADDEKVGINTQKAISLMMHNPSLIKRPILTLDDEKSLVGFKADAYAVAFS